MADKQPHRSKPADEIDINDEAECARWSAELGVSAGELKAAVHYAGRRVDDVRRYLEERTREHDKTPWGKP